MHFQRLEELNVFLALLFNSDISLPCMTVLKDVIFDHAAKKNASNEVEAFIKFVGHVERYYSEILTCLLYTSPSPRDLSTSRMPSSA